MNRINILIVDDHKIVRDGIKSLIDGQEGIAIIGEAQNGKDALEKVAELKPALVIMDINMPEMNGIEATKMIKKEEPQINVLALSMENNQQSIRKMIEAGASGYILKSASQEELKKAIHQITSGHHYFSEEAAQSILAEIVNPSIDNKKGSADIQITNRERDVLKLIVEEYTNQEIADELFISVRTVDAHRRNLLQKIGAKNTAGLVRFAIEKKLF